MPTGEDLASCYEILGLGRGASLEAVRKAYRQLVRSWHPDQFMDDEARRRIAERHMKLINMAHKTLVDFLSFRPPYHFRSDRRAQDRDKEKTRARSGRGGYRRTGAKRTKRQ